jgi:Helix-turn-helix domain
VHGDQNTPPRITASAPSTSKRAYRFQEFLEAYGVGKQTAYDAIRAGDLIAHKRGKSTIIRADDAEAYVASLPRLELARADEPARQPSATAASA